MAIYLMLTSGEGGGGGLDFSETTEKRKPMKNSDRWYQTDADLYPMGPFPDALHRKLETHWYLWVASATDLRPYFNSLTSNYFPGLPIYNKEIAAHAGEDVEVVQIPNLWSLRDKVRIETPYFKVNVYGTEETLDLVESGARKTARGAAPYSLSSKTRARIRPGFKTDRHIWRDTNTYDWFCSEVFREALAEVLNPKAYDYRPMRPRPYLVSR